MRIFLLYMYHNRVYHTTHIPKPTDQQNMKLKKKTKQRKKSRQAGWTYYTHFFFLCLSLCLPISPPTAVVATAAPRLLLAFVTKQRRTNFSSFLFHVAGSFESAWASLLPHQTHCQSNNNVVLGVVSHFVRAEKSKNVLCNAPKDSWWRYISDCWMKKVFDRNLIFS